MGSSFVVQPGAFTIIWTMAVFVFLITMVVTIARALTMGWRRSLTTTTRLVLGVSFAVVLGPIGWAALAVVLVASLVVRLRSG